MLVWLVTFVVWDTNVFVATIMIFVRIVILTALPLVRILPLIQCNAYLPQTILVLNFWNCLIIKAVWTKLYFLVLFITSAYHDIEPALYLYVYQAIYHQGESAASSLILGPPRTANGRDRERDRRAFAAGIRLPPPESAYANVLSGAAQPDRDRRFPHGMLRSLSFTCPICGSLGHTDKSLVAHVYRAHPNLSGGLSSGASAKDRAEGREQIVHN